MWAAYLYAGDGAVIGYSTAWWLADRKRDEPTSIDVVIPDPRIIRPQDGITVRRTRRWSPLDLHPTAVPRRHRLERAVLDCAAAARTTHDSVALLASAVQRRSTTVPLLRATLLRHPNLPRRRLLSGVLDLADEGAQTLLEVLHHTATTSHGLPAPVRQARIGDTVVDGLYVCPDGSEFVAEFDGRLGHFAVRDQWKDHRRDNRNTVDLRSTLRFPGFVLIEDPHEVAATIAAALTARGWTGTLRCPRGCPGARLLRLRKVRPLQPGHCLLSAQVRAGGTSCPTATTPRGCPGPRRSAAA